MNWQRKTLSALLLGVVVLFLSIAQLNSVANNFDKKVGAHVQAAQGVVDGLPHWRIYQSRVLGPYMVQTVKGLTGWKFQKSYVFMMFAWFVMMFTVLISVAANLWKSKLIAVGIAGAAAFLNTTVMQGMWLYPWDYLDFIAFTLLIWAILTNKPLKIIAAIILVEMFNRETAAIIAGWLALDAGFEFVLKKRQLSEPEMKAVKQQFIIGVGLTAVSLITIELLRNMLLVREIGPELFQDVKEAGPFFEIQLWSNLSMIASTLSNISTTMHAYNILIVVRLG
jgi:hypothetical protein